MPRLLTIRRRSDFSRLYASGSRRRSPQMTVVFARAATAEPARVAFVVSGRCGNAVTRNRIRRRLREAYQRLAARVRNGADLAIIAHPPAAQADFWVLGQTLQRLLESADVLCPVQQEGCPCAPSSSA